MASLTGGLSQGEPTPIGPEGVPTGPEHPQGDIFFAAIETTRMPMILTDPNQPDNPIVFVNQALVDMTGYQRPEMIGRNCRFLQGPDTDQDAIADIRRAVADRTEIATEILNYKKDGTAYWNALFISPVFDRKGQLVYFFASQLDVSRRRDTEEALRQAQKMEAVGQLTGGIAHDFNNLLQVITGYMDSLKVYAAASNNARVVRQVGAVSEAANRATALTQQLLAFSRKQKLVGRTVNLNQLVQGLSERAKPTLGDGITFTCALDADLWNSRVDPSQVEIALFNVTINARDAMPSGGTITIATSNEIVRAEDENVSHGLPPGRYAVVSVTDTGTGMPEAILNRVMDPFFTTKEEGKGTGLGLSMVYGFVRQSGGAVAIASQMGQGTTVRLLFPAAEPHVLPRTRPATQAIDCGGDERILVVDDRADVAEVARSMLEDFGYQVEVAMDGKAALAKLDEAIAFDMLFSDLIMPGGMNGVNLAREALRRMPKLKVLLTTGYADSAIERTDLGGTEFETISKPYRQPDLAKRIRKILDGPTGAG